MELISLIEKLGEFAGAIVTTKAHSTKEELEELPDAFKAAMVDVKNGVDKGLIPPLYAEVLIDLIKYIEDKLCTKAGEEDNV